LSKVLLLYRGGEDVVGRSRPISRAGTSRVVKLRRRQFGDLQIVKPMMETSPGTAMRSLMQY